MEQNFLKKGDVERLKIKISSQVQFVGLNLTVQHYYFVLFTFKTFVKPRDEIIFIDSANHSIYVI